MSWCSSCLALATIRRIDLRRRLLAIADRGDQPIRKQLSILPALCFEAASDEERASNIRPTIVIEAGDEWADPVALGERNVIKV